jgi:hypothetical protein
MRTLKETGYSKRWKKTWKIEIIGTTKKIVLFETVTNHAIKG